METIALPSRITLLVSADSATTRAVYSVAGLATSVAVMSATATRVSVQSRIDMEIE